MSVHFFPTADIDSNATYRTSDGSFISMTRSEYVSCPVEVGDLVLLVDVGDGVDDPFATWGRVIQTGNIIRFRQVADRDRFIYVVREVGT